MPPFLFPARSRAAMVVAWVLLAASPGLCQETIDYKTDVVYGTAAGEELKLDLATPKELQGPAPAVVLVHGGGWAGGSKRDFEKLARQIATAGYVVANIDYRLAPKHLFPAQVEDCKCAVRWLRAHADELRVEPERIGAMGGSAGGHLVMMLGAMDSADGLEGEGGWPDQSSKVQAVVNYVGPSNLLGEFPEISQQILKGFLGGPQAEKEALYRQASPVTYVNSGDAPVLFFAGTKDPLVPYDQAFQMTAALDKANVPGRVEILVGASHGWGGAEMERTMRASLEFLALHLKR